MARVDKIHARLGYLDSIRGVAAFVVVFHHCWLLNTFAFREKYNYLSNISHELSVSGLVLYALARVGESGRAAVILFFVLSGFVLTYSLGKGRGAYRGYAIKRIFRIYPAFLFIVTVSFFLHRLIGSPHDSAEWVKSVLHPDLTAAEFLRHVFLVGTNNSYQLDNVIWTLVHEVRISLLFPFILITVKRYGWKSVAIYSALSAACTAFVFHVTGSVVTGYLEQTFPMTFLDTGYFIIFFVAGAYLALKREAVAAWIGSFPVWLKFGFLFAFCYCLIKMDYYHNKPMSAVTDYIHGLGAVGLIALALGVKKISRVFDHGVLAWLGRISYSLYLVHLPIMYVVSQTIGASWHVWQMSLAIILLSLLCAELMARFIEFPGIALGKKLSARLAKA